LATLGTVQIADKESRFDSGAAFLLSDKSHISAVISVPSGREVEVRKGNPYIVARIKGASKDKEAFSSAYNAAQIGLDILSIEGKARLLTRDVFNDSLLWWRGPSGQVLRIISTAVLGIQGSAVGLVVMNGGKVVPPSPIPVTIYHESLRYFSLSQVSKDVFESFLNMYLAFEALLGITTKRGEKEGESAWLKRALIEAGASIPFDKIYGTNTKDPVEKFNKQIYKKIRCAVFHSKDDSRLLPMNLTDRKRVSEGLDKLSDIVVTLAEKRLNYRYQKSWASNEVHDGPVRSLFDNSVILISNRKGRLDKKELADSPVYKNAIEVKCMYKSGLSEPGLVYVLGRATASDLSAIRRIWRVAVKKGDVILAAAGVEAALRPKGIDILEVQIGSRFENMGMPKHFFDS